MAKFCKPTPKQVVEYGQSRGFPIDGEEFCDFYESKGWVVGKSPMKDWQAAVRTWERTWRKRTGNLKTSPEMDNLATELTREISENEAKGLLSGLFPEVT